MPRALVLGGGGHLGATLCHLLQARGWEVVASTLGDGPRANLGSLPLERVTGDDAVPGRVADWAAGCSLIIDAAAPYGLSLRAPDQSDQQRIEHALIRMQQILTVVRGQGIPLAYVGSYLTAPDESRPVQDRVLSASHPYFRIKRALEAAVMGAAAEGAPVLCVNPTSFLGPGNLRPFSQCFVAAVMTGQMPASFPNVINVMDVRDAAEILIRASEQGFWGTRLMLSGHSVDVHGLTGQIAALSGARCPPRWRALGAGAAVMYAAEQLQAFWGGQSNYPVLPVLLTLASRAVPLSALQRELGGTPRPLEQTLRDEIDWYLARGAQIRA